MIRLHELPPVGVLARGEADAAGRDYAGRKPVDLVRYADPIAWLTATAVWRAWQEGGADLPPENVGLITIGVTGPTQAMQSVAAGTAAGQPSALRFPAASPCTLAGVACIVGGFCGPTLNLTMTPADGTSVALLMAHTWLRSGSAGAVAVATYSASEARCALLAPGGRPAPAADVAGWLAGTSQV